MSARGSTSHNSERKLIQAAAEASAQPIAKKSHIGKKRWGVTKNVAAWEVEQFGSFSVKITGELVSQGQVFEAEHFQALEEVCDGPNLWVPVSSKIRRPRCITLNMRVRKEPGIKVHMLANGERIEITGEEVPAFRVPIHWEMNDRTGEWYPSTREKGKDNVDLVYHRQDGTFVQLQASVITRNKRAFVCVQEVYTGVVAYGHPTAIAKTSYTSFTRTLKHGERAGQEVSCVVMPAYSESCYPGSDYAQNFKYGVEGILDYAFESGSVMELSHVPVTRWMPQAFDDLSLDEKMVARGWLRGQVMWFNAVIGWGFICLENGQACFVHFSAIQDASGRPFDFPILTPSTVVAVKPGVNEKGQPKANVVMVPQTIN